MCVQDFQFFMITSQTGLNGNDGILGLSPANEQQNGPSFIKSLYDQGTIDQEIATFWLNYNGDADSLIMLGGVPPNSTVGETFSQDLVERYDQWWTVKMHDVNYGDDGIKDSGIGYAILDTGTSLLYLGTEDYYNFVDKLKAKVPGLDCSSNIYCFSDTQTCDAFTPDMESLTITLGENHYTLPPEAYTFSRGNNHRQKMCTVAISYTDSSSGVYILGDTFLRNFVTTFDYKTSEMRLAINTNAPPGITIEYKMSGWKIFGLILAAICGVAFIIFLVVCCVKKHKKAKVAKGYSQIGAS